MPLLDTFLARIIRTLLYAIIILTPYIFLPWTSELFEFNKMLFVYIATTGVLICWLSFIPIYYQFPFRTAALLPIMLFLIAMTAATITSIHPHTSIWGYYSRFHGGLASILAFIILYHAFLTFFESKHIKQLATVLLLSTLGVAIYGVLQHFGIDAHIWKQDVRNRVFSTFGQPNWLAAYIVALVPLTWARIIQTQHNKPKQIFLTGNLPAILLHPLFYHFTHTIFLLCLIYSGSRSGFLAYVVTYILFWGVIAITFDKSKKVAKKTYLTPLLQTSIVALTILLLFGTPFTPRIHDLINNTPENQVSNSQLLVANSQPDGGTDSGVIRQIVWQGAIDLGLRYPLLGTGLETFAYSYYWTRPVAHNATSEWDFLYNKAHNEYLNFWATTGVIGTGTYLFLIAYLIYKAIRHLYTLSILPKVKTHLKETKRSKTVAKSSATNYQLLTTSYFVAFVTGWISLLITNFFGFSVVGTSLLFWSLPVLWQILSHPQETKIFPIRFTQLLPGQIASSIAIVALTALLLGKFVTIFIADLNYEKSDKLHTDGSYVESLELADLAAKLNPSQPILQDHIAQVASDLAIQAYSNNLATQSALLIQMADIKSQEALAQNPWHINFYKNRAAYFITLSSIDPNLSQEAINAMQAAQKLAPTDPKIVYNLGLLHINQGDYQTGLSYLQKSYELKPDYDPAIYALALYLQKDAINDQGNITKHDQYQTAIRHLEQYLQIHPDHQSALNSLSTWQQHLATTSSEQ